MTIVGTDDQGAYVDTGSNTTPSTRPSIEIQTHLANELDTASKLTIAQLVASHIPHRSAT